MLRKTSQAAWELFEVDAEGLPTNFIDGDNHLSLVVWRGNQGDFSLQEET